LIELGTSATHAARDRRNPRQCVATIGHAAIFLDSSEDCRPHRLYRRRDRWGMQNGKEPAIVAPLYRMRSTK